jgi:hypothetical protein
VGLDLGASALQFTELQLIRDAANVLAHRNGVNAQGLRIYNTFTDASNWERLQLNWTSNIAEISTDSAGTGSFRELYLVGAKVVFWAGTSYAASLRAWIMETAGHLTTGTDNVYDIGTAVGVRPRSLYLGTSLVMPSGTILTDDAANILALRNGANAQTLRVYNTFTDANNYERGGFLWTGNTFYVLTQEAGTGTPRNLYIGPTGSAEIHLITNSTGRFFIKSTGEFCAEVDNTYDIGASGANRPRAIYVAGSTGIKHQAGTSTLEATMVGVANVNTTAVGNVGAGEDDLITYSLPANALSANAKGVRIRAWGTGANNANAKTLKLYFGTQVILTTALTASQVDTWEAEATVWRTGASTQDWQTRLNQAGTTSIIDIENGTATQTDTAAITIKCTGTGTSNNDVVAEGMLTEFIN